MASGKYNKGFIAGALLLSAALGTTANALPANPSGRPDQVGPLAGMAARNPSQPADPVNKQNADRDSNAVTTVTEKVKHFTKSYTAEPGDQLSVDNKFGNVRVNTWKQNEIKVDVEVKIIAGDESTAQRMLDAIQISDSKKGNVVSFKTEYGTVHSLWNSLFNDRNDHHKAEVNYTVYMPAANGLQVKNRFGNTEVAGGMDGLVNLDCSYGNVLCKFLLHARNIVNVRYGSARIEGITGGEVNISYGSLELGTAGKLDAGIRYSSAKIGRITSSANLDAHYAGAVIIDNLDKDFSSLNCNSSYSTVSIGLDNTANVSFDVTVRFGSFTYGSLPVQIKEKIPADDSRGWKPTTSYKGYVGKGGSEKMLHINASYGSVKLH